MRRAWLLLWLCLLLAGAARPVSGQQGPLDRERFGRDLAALTAHPSRVIGSAGYDEAAAYLERELAALGPAIEWRRHEYPVMAPVTTSATLATAPGETVHRVYPFWPAGVRLCSTPAEGITGRAVYCGNASYGEIKPKDVDGQIAVVEASAREFWTHAPYFGARAVLVLGSRDTSHVDLRAHDLIIPVDLPRFYVPPGSLADALRGGRITGDVTLKAKVNWRRIMARNYYALVKAKPGGAAKEAQGAAALAISVPFESSGLVPDLAVGASQAVQAASGLAILRDAAARPLDRPVMVFFGGADSIQFLATRNMFLALSDVPAAWETQRRALQEERERAERDLGRLRDVAGRSRVLDVAADRGVIDRIVKIIEGDLSLEQDELFRLRRKPDASLTAGEREQMSRLEERQLTLNQLRYGFQQRPARVASDFPEEANAYVARTIERLAGSGGARDTTGGLPRAEPRGIVRQLSERHAELSNRAELYRWLAGALGRNPNPSARANNSRLIELLVALDFSDGGSRAGPLYWGWFQQTPNISQIQDYRDWFAQQARALAADKPESQWLRPLMGVLDFAPLSGARAPQSWLATSLPVGSEMCRAWGVPGFSMITLDDPRLRRDTPTDTLEQIDTTNILPQLEATWALLRNGWNDPRFIGQPEHKWMRAGFEGQVVGTAVGRPVADLPREGFLATYYHAKNEVRRIPDLRGPTELPYTLGIRRSEVRDCDAEGRYRFEGLPVLAASSEPKLLLLTPHAYRVTPDTGEINGCSDLGRQSADLKLFADLQKPLDPFRTVVFSCDPFTLVGLYDPRFLQTLNEVVPLDAGRNAEPQRYNAIIRNQMMAGFVEPGTRNHLIFRFGNVGNRLLLINAPDRAGAGAGAELSRAEGRGFTAAQLNDLGPLALVTARDFWRLDDRRIREYAKAGVTSALIDAMHQEAGEQIARAQEALAANDASRLMEQANGAWANNARVYAAVDDMARDVVRAAIFLLLLCVPFSFCMERLLIGTPNIYKQIAGAVAIFATMAAALWSFHPAFKISSSPLIIILAFAIIFMSIVVIVVVYGKFDTELKRVRSGRGTMQSASFARGSVLLSAVLLGIANMRKRRFRTGLTALTIILITFAVLCFTSSTRFVGTSTLATGEPAPHPGLMLRQRGFRPMSPIVAENLRPLLPGREVVERWWNVNAVDPKEHLHVVARAPGGVGGGGGGGGVRVFAAQAVLGLSPGEAGLSRIDEVIGQQRFAALENGQSDVIYLPSEAAEQLGVREGDVVRLAGHPLTVAGVFDAAAFDEKAIALSGEPLAPLRYTVGALDAGGRELKNNDADSLDLGGGGSRSEAGAYEHLSGSQIVIVPASVARALPNASLRSVEVRLENQAQVEAAGAELAKRFSLAMFAGYDDGVRLVTAGNLASVSGAGQVAIPLVLAGLIIFNTMMGSIAERKREIHVYTSLGLAPMHVGALFVAEALTYGLIGTVFGYVIGQGVGTVLLKLGWLGNVTLNYSGTSAILTMGLILLIVLVSALVPARIASRIAAPSIERTWQVPQPQGDEIRAVLPFTINRTAAEGALAYLAQFFEEHREGSIGKFSAGEVQVVPPQSGSDRSRAIRTLIWLTPFDLGVRQRLQLLIRPPSASSPSASSPSASSPSASSGQAGQAGDFDIYEVHVVLQRLSGDDASWYRMNRTFLTELRKQFLQWRSLTPQRMLKYVEESRGLFGTTAATVTTSSEPVATAQPA